MTGGINPAEGSLGHADLGLRCVEVQRRCDFGVGHFHEEGDAHFVAIIDGDVDGVLAGLIEFELLDVDDEVADEEIGVARNDHIQGHIDAWHDEAAVFVDEVHFHFVGSFLDAVKGNAERDGTLRMDRGQLTCENGVKSAEKIQFPVVIGGRVAQNRNLDGHTAARSYERADLWQEANGCASADSPG